MRLSSRQLRLGREPRHPQLDMKYFAVLAVWLAVSVPAGGTDYRSHRRVRHLVYPPNGSKVQFILGFGVPIDLPHQALTMGYVIKSNYMVPFNATQYTKPFDAFPSPLGARHQRSAKEGPSDTLASRWDLYAVLEHAVEQMSQQGSGIGRQCLLRAVCESAVFNLRHDGLLGELLHVVLTPSSTNEPVRRHHDYEYHAAERAGRLSRNALDPVERCTALFPGCATGALDLFTRILYSSP